MNQPLMPCLPFPSVEAMQAAFLTILPRIQLHAQIYFRHLKCPGKKADAIAEVIAISWKWFVRLARKGKDATRFPTALARFAARSVQSGRKVAGMERAKDVMNATAQKQHGFLVESLPISTARSRGNPMRASFLPWNFTGHAINA